MGFQTRKPAEASWSATVDSPQLLCRCKIFLKMVALFSGKVNIQSFL